jgi:hypothetical protein
LSLSHRLPTLVVWLSLGLRSLVEAVGTLAGVLEGLLFRAMSIDEPPSGQGSPPPPQTSGLPPETSGPPPLSAPPVAPAQPWQQVGVVPERLSDVYYRTGLTIFLTIITFGIWGFLWTYRTSEDLKRYNGDGLGGVLGIVIYLLISIVLMFTIPNEIKNMYERDGRPSPITAVWGLWFLLPLIGNIVWYVKVQRVLNEFWLSKGSRPA